MYELRTTLIAAGEKAAYDSVAKTFWLTNKYLHGYSREQQNTISRYKISHESVYGDFNDMSRHDLLQVVMVRIPSEQNKDRASNAPLKLHEMLYDLIIRKMNSSDKIKLLQDRYGLIMNDQEGRMDVMCNLSDYFVEEGYSQGISQGINEGYNQATEAFVASMLKKNKSAGEISELCDIPLELVEQIQDKLLQNASL